jgi:hypothetical protein
MPISRSSWLFASQNLDYYREDPYVSLRLKSSKDSFGLDLSPQTIFL